MNRVVSMTWGWSKVFFWYLPYLPWIRRNKIAIRPCNQDTNNIFCHIFSCHSYKQTKENENVLRLHGVLKFHDFIMLKKDYSFEIGNFSFLSNAYRVSYLNLNVVFLHFGHFGGVPLTILSHTAAASSGFLLSFCTDLSLYLLNDISGSISVHLPSENAVGLHRNLLPLWKWKYIDEENCKYSLFLLQVKTCTVINLEEHH